MPGRKKAPHKTQRTMPAIVAYQGKQYGTLLVLEGKDSSLYFAYALDEAMPPHVVALPVTDTQAVEPGGPTERLNTDTDLRQEPVS